MSLIHCVANNFYCETNVVARGNQIFVAPTGHKKEYEGIIVKSMSLQYVKDMANGLPVLIVKLVVLNTEKQLTF